MQKQIDEFLSGSVFAVVGASRDRSKIGNKVLRAYLQNDRTVYAVNPSAETVEGLKAYPTLAALPVGADGVSIITPPEVSEEVIRSAGALGIKHAWLQPGAESQAAVELAERLGMNVIAGGPCVLVALGYRE